MLGERVSPRALLWHLDMQINFRARIPCIEPDLHLEGVAGPLVSWHIETGLSFSVRVTSPPTFLSRYVNSLCSLAILYLITVSKREIFSVKAFQSPSHFVPKIKQITCKRTVQPPKSYKELLSNWMYISKIYIISKCKSTNGAVFDCLPSWIVCLPEKSLRRLLFFKNLEHLNQIINLKTIFVTVLVRKNCITIGKLLPRVKYLTTRWFVSHKYHKFGRVH